MPNMLNPARQSPKPITFSAEEVLLILDGQKTQFRLPLKPQPILVPFGNETSHWHWKDCQWLDGGIGFPKSGITDYALYHEGDILRVCEAWQYCNCEHQTYTEPCPECNAGGYLYQAHCKQYEGYNDIQWNPASAMPVEATRLFIKVKNVRVERLRDITVDDARAEGISEKLAFECNGWSPSYYDPDSGGHADYRAGFFCEWDLLHEANGYGWEVNPFVWGYEFEIIEKSEGLA